MSAQELIRTTLIELKAHPLIIEVETAFNLTADLDLMVMLYARLGDETGWVDEIISTAVVMTDIENAFRECLDGFKAELVLAGSVAGQA